VGWLCMNLLCEEKIYFCSKKIINLLKTENATILLKIDFLDPPTTFLLKISPLADFEFEPPRNSA
jgi:hypothetical protein